MSVSMPPGGSALRAEIYEATAAYILEKNGATAGTEPIRAATTTVIEKLVAE